MITLLSGYNHIQGENSYGCSKKCTSWLASAVEITLIVVGILAVAEVGVFLGYSKVTSIIILSSGAFVLLVDIIRAVLNCNIISKAKAVQDAKQARLDATGVTLHHDRSGKHTINLGPLIPSSGAIQHVYPVLTAREKDLQVASKPLKDNEFILFFGGDGSPTLNNVWMVRNILFQHMAIHDWLVNHDQPENAFCGEIEKGTLIYASTS